MCKKTKVVKKKKKMGKTTPCAKLVFGDEVVTYRATIMEKRDKNGRKR